MASGDDGLAQGTEINEFVVEQVLGVGGFGVTYLAADRKLDRWVAIKEYLPRDWGARQVDGTVGPRSSSDAEDYRWGLARFLEEARTLARLDDARILRVYQVLEGRGTAYMVTEYVEGRNLEETLTAEGPWPEARVRALLEDLLPGLAAVHQADLVHRDIKPANVMVRADGRPVLIDFGAARYAAGVHSHSLASVLTPGYAPHEQYRTDGKQGPWTDVYALGAVAYRALSGRSPVEATARVPADPLAPLAEVAPGRVSEAFGKAVAAALAVWPEDRPQDVAAWRAQWDQRVAAQPLSPLSTPSPAKDSAESGNFDSGRGRRSSGAEMLFGTWPYWAMALILLLMAVISSCNGDTVKAEIAPECLQQVRVVRAGRQTYELNDMTNGTCPTRFYGFTLDQPAYFEAKMTSTKIDSELTLSRQLPSGSIFVLDSWGNDDGRRQGSFVSREHNLDGKRDANIGVNLDAGSYTIAGNGLYQMGDFTLVLTVAYDRRLN